jgi:hypothetical protein
MASLTPEAASAAASQVLLKEAALIADSMGVPVAAAHEAVAAAGLPAVQVSHVVVCRAQLVEAFAQLLLLGWDGLVECSKVRGMGRG